MSAHVDPDPFLRRLTSFEVRCVHGYRSFELWKGDITDLPFAVDLLAISAFKGALSARRASVISALHRRGVDVSELARSPAYDFRATPLSCWVSGEISTPTRRDVDVETGQPIERPRFRRIACMETSWGDRKRPLEHVYRSLFGVHALLEQQLGAEGAIRTLAIPALGTGNQGFDVHEVVPRLVTAASDALESARVLERIVFVAYDDVAAESFRVALDDRLQRVRVSLRGERLKAVREDAAAQTRTLLSSGCVPAAGRVVLDDLQRLLSWEEAGNFELGIAGRRLAEVVVATCSRRPVGERRGAPDLLTGIEELASHHISDWVRSYLHTLRVFGNESAHAKHAAVRVPAQIDERDLELWCHCLRRVLEFWLHRMKGTGDR